MSPEIIDTIVSYTTEINHPLMIIASRNQIDHNSGYVMNTQQLVDRVGVYDKSKLLICRDHCGPYFLDSERNLTEREAVEATKKTIAMDIETGFDLIHIDTSRIDNGYAVAEELIKFCLKLNPDVKFEFGTEENVGVAAGIAKYKSDVAFAKQFPNMQFVVAQTGSLVKEDYQAGTFDINAVTTLVGYANEAGVKLKEHNADYLTAGQIQLRRAVSVHALNIAPQLGVIQTRIIKDAAREQGLDDLWNQFAQAVIDSGKWAKWIITGDDNLKVDIAGHYLYKDKEYRQLVDALDISWRQNLTVEMHHLFDHYTWNFSG